MKVRHVVFLFIVSLLPSAAFSQVITPALKSERLRTLELEARRLEAQVRTLEAIPVDPETLTPRTAQIASVKNALEATKDAAKAEQASNPEPRTLFLSQAGLEGGTTGPQISIDAAHLYFRNGRTVFHLRSTLPTNPEADTAPVGTLDERIKSAVSDPYGGLLYLAVGQRTPVCLHSDVARQRVCKAKRPNDNGWFFDVRGGAKFVQLPGDAGNAGLRASAFGVLSGGLRLRQSLWLDEFASEEAGLLEVSANIVVNRAIDRTVSPLVGEGGELSGWPTGLDLAIGLRLVGNIGLTLRGTPWTNKPLSREFTIGLSLLK